MRATGFFSLFRQDMAVTLRNSLAWFLMGTAVILILTVNYAIPVDFEPEQEFFYHDGTREKILEVALMEAGYGEELFLATPKEVEERVESQKGSVGIILSGTVAEPRISLVSTGQVSSHRLNIIYASLESMVANILEIDRDGGYSVEYLREQAAPIAKNLMTIPSLLAFEVLITGFLLVSVLMFQEKQEKSILAYRVTPGTAGGYILAKALVFTVVSLVYGIVFVLFTVGISVNWPLLILVLSLGAVLYTLLGIIVAVFFNSISEWFFVGVGLLTLNMLPIISYTIPTFSPTFIRWIPSYPIVFGLRDVLFPTGRAMLPLIWLLLVLIGVAYGVSHVLVSRKLLREGR